MDNNLTQILLDWINVYIPSHYTINSETYWDFLGDTEEPFVQIQESVYRKKMLLKYLSEPTEKSIHEFLGYLQQEYNASGNVQKRAIFKVLNRFKQ